MMIGYYAGAALLSMVLLFIFIHMGLKLNICYILTYVGILIANFGYLSIALSHTVEEALMANRIVYIASVFIPLFFFSIVADLCRIRLTRPVLCFLVFIALIVLFCSLTPGYNGLYYSSVELRSYNNSSYLVKEYGPLHIVYLLQWGSYMLALAVVVTRSFFRQELVSYKTATVLALLTFFNAITYLAERLIGIPLELIPLSYCVSETLLLLRLHNINLYDMSSNAAEVLKRRSEYGYLTFSTDLQFTGHNEFAAEIYPEILQLRIDHHVHDLDNRFGQEIIQWLKAVIDGTDDSTEKIIVRGDRFLKCTFKSILQGNKDRHVGYLVEFNDDTTQQKYIRQIESFNETLEQEVAKKTASLRQMQEDIILSFANIVESRDHVTGGHIKRTSGYVRILANQLAKMDIFPEFRNKKYIKDLCMAAPLHDIGKIAIPDVILNKPGKYEPQEYMAMKKHPLLGGNILDETLSTLEDQEYYMIAWQTAMYHHERWDGSGYPTGLSGKEIPLCARVMAIADVFDALTSQRPYKDEFTLEQALDIIRNGKGTQFDPRLVDAFMICRAQFASYCVEQREAREVLSKDDLDNLMQTVFNEEAYSNAYQVSYSEWGRFVTYLKNLAIRNKQNMYMVMFTVESKIGEPLTDEQKRLAVVNLKLAVVSSLRNSDMTTQISAYQRVILLLNIDTRGVSIVIHRILDAFARQSTDEDITVNYVISNPLGEDHENDNSGASRQAS